MSSYLSVVRILIWSHCDRRFLSFVFGFHLILQFPLPFLLVLPFSIFFYCGFCFFFKIFSISIIFHYHNITKQPQLLFLDFMLYRIYFSQNCFHPLLSYVLFLKVLQYIFCIKNLLFS